jgi:Tfp pilus assembly protein PilF
LHGLLVLREGLGVRQGVAVRLPELLLHELQPIHPAGELFCIACELTAPGADGACQQVEVFLGVQLRGQGVHPEDMVNRITEWNEMEKKYQEALEFQRNGLYKEAAAAYRNVIQLDPSFYKAYTNLGSVLLKNLKRTDPDCDKRFSEAVGCYTKALELRPDDAITLYNLGTIEYENFDNEEKAFDYFARAINADPYHGQKVYGYLSWASYHPQEDFSKVIERSIYRPDHKKILDSLVGLQSKPDLPAAPSRMIRIEDRIKTFGSVLVLIGIFYLLVTPLCDKIAFKNTFVATILLFLAVLGGIAGISMAKSQADKIFNGLLVVFFLIIYYRVILGCYHP